MKSFVDTNIPIAYVFLIDPLTKKSNYIYNKYDNIYWSKNVYDEFDYRLKEKLYNLSKFYNILKEDLRNWPKSHISKVDMIDYLQSQNYDYKFYNDIMSSFDPVLYLYLGTLNYIDVKIMETEIYRFLDDLRINTFLKAKECESINKCTPLRKKKYEELFHKLVNSLGVHESDANIILDAYDYNLRLKEKLDFITFDNDCYWGAYQIKEFDFNKVLGVYDFY